MGMEFLKDRRLVIAGGVALALLAGLIFAMTRPKNPKAPPPAAEAGLKIDIGRDDDLKIDPQRQLRCFVSGQFVGLTTLADCAKRNGVASGALDVGIDETGALAAADQLGATLTPLPPSPAELAPTPAPAALTPPAGQADVPVVRGPPMLTCWRYERNWNRMADMTLNACVQALFANRCEEPGGATYGRWGDQTLRLVPGRVEQSSDNRSFRVLAEQGAGCSIPSL